MRPLYVVAGFVVVALLLTAVWYAFVPRSHGNPNCPCHHCTCKIPCQCNEDLRRPPLHTGPSPNFP